MAGEIISTDIYIYIYNSVGDSQRVNKSSRNNVSELLVRALESQSALSRAPVGVDFYKIYGKTVRA